MAISSDKSLRINYQITAKQIRVIDAEGKQLGLLKTQEAQSMAEEAGLDLVEISPQAEPPVCRIMDYGKFLFQQSKKKAAAKKKQKQILIKELKYRPVIEEGDYLVKLRKMIGFLEEGHKVKVSMRFRGRELDHTEIGVRLFERLQSEIQEHGIIEQSVRFEGQQIVMLIGPKKK